MAKWLNAIGRSFNFAGNICIWATFVFDKYDKNEKNKGKCVKEKNKV